MVLLSRRHVLERHGQDVIQVLTDSWPAMRASAKAFVLSTLSLIKVMILALATAGVHEVALRGLHKFSVLRTAQMAVLGRGLWVLQRFPQPSPQQVSQPRMVSGEGEKTSLQHQSCLCDMCKLLQKSLKHVRQVEHGRLRQPLVHGSVDLPVALDEARCIGRKARRSAHLPSVEHRLSAVVARVPMWEWRRKSN